MSKEPFYTQEQILEHTSRIVKYGLAVVASFFAASAQDIAKACNGVGPERWPDWVCRVLNTLLGLFEEAVILHDWEFASDSNDGTVESWHETNDRFLRNCKTLVRRKIRPWRFLRRREAFAAAETLYDFVETKKGWQAWREAYERKGLDKSSQPS